MAAFNFHRRKTRHWWYAGATLIALAFFAVFFVVGASALNNSPSHFEVGDGNLTLDATANTDWNCFQGTPGFQSSSNYGTTANPGTFSKPDCNKTTGANNNSSPDPKFEQTPGQKFDTACPTFKAGNNPPKDVWSDVGEYIEGASNNDIYFYGASIRPVVNGNSSGNIYFSQGTNPAGAGCRTVGDVLLTFDFLGGGSKPTLHILTWQGPGGSCFVGSDSPTTGCWGPSTPPLITGANSDGETNATQINGSDNALNGQNILANGFSEIGVNLTQAIKLAGGGASCFANETWVSRSSGSSFTSSPEMVVIDQQPTCGTITVVKDTWDGAGHRTGINTQFSYSTTGGLSPSSFHLNDAGGATGDVACTADSTTTSPCNSTTYKDVAPGSYSVTEGAEPANFAFVSLSCQATGNATSADTTTTPGTAAITLGISGNVVCTYVNQQQLGAIAITKTNGKGGRLNGATFEITGPNSYDQSFTTSGTGTSAGTICVSGLPFSGTGTYTVTETAAPTGYSKDPTPQSKAVNAFGDCSGNGTPVAFSFDDTPLTTLEVIATSETTNHATKSTISCVNSGGTGVGTSITTFTDPADWKTLHLTPDTYTCTVVIDP